jgi:hypothetical protein
VRSGPNALAREPHCCAGVHCILRLCNHAPLADARPRCGRTSACWHAPTASCLHSPCGPSSVAPASSRLDLGLADRPTRVHSAGLGALGIGEFAADGAQPVHGLPAVTGSCEHRRAPYRGCICPACLSRGRPSTSACIETAVSWTWAACAPLVLVSRRNSATSAFVLHRRPPASACRLPSLSQSCRRREAQRSCLGLLSLRL